MRKLFIDEGQTKKTFDNKKVAELLDAEEVLSLGKKGGIPSFLALPKLADGLIKSSGGRPRLVGTLQKRTKIPLFEGDWEKLEQLSELLKLSGQMFANGQLASLLLHKAIDEMLFQIRATVSQSLEQMSKKKPLCPFQTEKQTI